MLLDIFFVIVKSLFGEANNGGVIVKALLVFLLGTTVAATADIVWESATEEVVWNNDEARRISRCETYLKEKRYGELWEYLELYDLKGERYEIYWNAVENRLEEIHEIQLEQLAEIDAKEIEAE